MDNIISYFNTADQTTLWTLHIFLVVLGTLLVNLLVKRILILLMKRTEQTHNLWDDALFHALQSPLRLLVWIIGLTLAVEVAFKDDTSTVFSFIYPARDVGVIVSITWFILRFIRFVEENIFKHKEGKNLKLDRTTLNAMGKLLRVATLITAALITMETLGFSIGGVLAFGGIGGMAVGFAAKDMLANFFGAMMIYFDRPFKEGDWIRSPDKEIEGTVEEIGWRQTRIRTFDKRPLYVPNSVFSTIAVQNPSRMTHRRIHETIGVRYDDIKQVHSITENVRDMLKEHPEIATDQTLMVHLNAFNDSSVDFFIYSFTKTTDWATFHAIKQDVLLKIAAIIEDHGAEIAFPTSTLHIPEEINVKAA